MTGTNGFVRRIWLIFNKEQHIAPLAVLRVAYGLVMLISTIRFMLKGWVYDFYIAPKFYFPFYGFEWVKPLPATVMYTIFILMIIASFFIMIGFLYRIAIAAFFTLFVYVELIDKTYYLNHYYFISIITFLILLVPAHRYFSVDVWRKPLIKVTRIPGWTVNIFKWQLCLIYFLAGISKLNYDWLCLAMPLKIWLPANADLPIVGHLFSQTWLAYLFSWFGAAFDLSIGFLLLYRPTRPVAYLLVLVFHILTGWLFKIGMFPYIMIAVTIIFLSEDFHKKLIFGLRNIFKKDSANELELPVRLLLSGPKKAFLYMLLSIYVLLQLILPFRYLLYPGALFWTEEGYRFSWRVMLMEKWGTAFFYIKDPQTGRKGEVDNSKFLTPLQERMMSTQPDMILQYAHYLGDVYAQKGIKNPVVSAECYVTLNGSGSRLYIDSSVDLSRQTENFFHKKWILPFQANANK